jgi:hypothetical protein
VLDQYFGLTVEDETAFRTLHYSWESPGRRPLANRPISILDLIRRLNRLPCPVLLTVDFVPDGDVSKSDICKVRFRAQLFVSADCSPESFGHVEQVLRSVFTNTPLSPTLYQQGDRPPFQAISRASLTDLITLPAPTELHRLNLTGADSPIDAWDMSLPSAYIEPSLSLGWPYDSQGTVGDTTIGYGQSRQPVTVLRVNQPQEGNAPPPEYLADIRTLAKAPYPVFVLHTRAAAEHYGKAVDEAIESIDDISLDYQEGYLYRSILGTSTDAAFHSVLENRLLDVLTGEKFVTIVDFSKLDYPQANLSSFVAALDSAIRKLPETGQSVACGVAIDDAAATVFDDVLYSLSPTSGLASRANLILNCQYPVGASVSHSGTPGSRTTAKQTDLLATLMTDVADGTVLENSERVLTLLDRITLRDEVRAALESTAGQLQGGWLWYDRTAPAAQPVVGGVHAHRDDSELPAGADYLIEHYGRIKSTMQGLYDISSQTIHWSKYEPSGDVTGATAETQSQSATADSGGQPDTRIARPIQTDDDTLPAGARFDTASDTYICQECSTRYNSTQQGLRNVCQCCSKTPALVDRDALRCLPPIDLKLSPEEIRASQLSEAQLTFLQACYLAKQFAFDPVFQFDPLVDSMQQIVTDLGLDSSVITELRELTLEGTGVLTKQTETAPHTVYNVTAMGRKQIAEKSKYGIDFGPGTGDLNASTLHHIGVCFLCLYLEAEYAQDPDRTVSYYYELESGEIVDAVVRDVSGAVVVAAEMECHNNDVGGASSSCRSTYEKLMSLDVEEAIWVFQTSEHWEAVTAELATAHQDPMSPIEFRADGYSRSYISKDPALTYSGITEALTLAGLVKQVEYPVGLYSRDLSRFGTA